MQPAKRIKTQGCDNYNISEKKQKRQKHDKSSIGLRPHKQSSVHLKSISKDITPKKQSITIQRSKFKQVCGSSKKVNKNRQLTSVCSYSAIQKQSIPATKRKGSNANNTRSIKKKNSKNKQQIQQSLKSTVNNFSILTKCLSQFIKSEKKKGKDPSKQILQLIKAFNRSQVAPLSKQLELLISNMLNYIEDTVQFPESEAATQHHEQRGSKSRSSFSSASQHQIAYSQIFENSQVPTTVKKSLKIDVKQQSSDLQQIQERPLKKHIKYNQQQNIHKSAYIDADKKITKQFEKQLKQDLKNMHDQLYYLKSAGQKLQNKAENREQDKKKLQQIYHKNKKLLEGLSNTKTNTQNLKRTQQSKNNQYQFNQSKQEQSEEQDDNY